MSSLNRGARDGKSREEGPGQMDNLPSNRKEHDDVEEADSDMKDDHEKHRHHSSPRRKGASPRRHRHSSRQLSSRSTGDRRRKEGGASGRPSYSRSKSDRVSSSHSGSRERRRQRTDSPSKPSYRRSSSERPSSSNNKRWNSRSRQSSRRLPRKTSARKNGATMVALDDVNEEIPNSAIHRRSGEVDEPSAKAALTGSERSNEAINNLYGEDEYAKAKIKTSSGTSESAITPGVEHIGSQGNILTDALYGGDSGAKAKAMGSSSERATTPGVEHIDQKTNSSLNTLYHGNSETDAKLKAKVSSPTSEPARTPGAKEVFSNPVSMSSSKHSATTNNTLYGNSDADSKAKAKASSGSSTIPGVDRVFSPASSSIWQKAKVSRGSLEQMSSPSSNTIITENSATINTLYGDDADADTKAKAKASRGSNEPVSNPGVESVFASSRSLSTVSTLYGSEADAKAKARASRGISSDSPNFPDTQSVATSRTVDTLYGNDAKAKARLGSSALAANPGVESVAHRLTMAPLTDDDSSVSATSTTDEHLENEEVEEPVARRVSMGSTDHSSNSSNMSEPERRADAGPKGVSSEAMEGFRMPNDIEEGSKKRKRSKRKAVEDTRKKSRTKCIGCWLLFLLLIMGASGVAAWYFLIRNSDTDEIGLSSGNTNIQDRAKSPSSSTVASLSPSESPTATGTTWFPSSPPSRGLTYERPSDSDCRAMALNQTISGRETMENVDFELGVEVVLSENNTLTEKLLQELLGAIQKKILPSLAGCSVDMDEMVEAWRFVIFDAFVTGSVPPDGSCIDEALMELNCHRVSVKLDLFLKGNMRFLDIIGLISAEEENISSHLGLLDPFSIVKLIGAKSLIPTDAPTRMPSGAPSFSPTDFPTVQASSNPTSFPSVLPTKTPTEEPSPSPTIAPSAVPSMVPSTALPTVASSVRPSMTPSESPSVRPTIMFSGFPTRLPSRAPSSRPSEGPSMQPSALPSGSPSSAPSASPSVSPAPSMIPTIKPSVNPSAEPSRSPTIAPSAEPTITSFHWVTCGRRGRCGGPATVQNSNFAKIGGGSGKDIAVRCCSDTLLPGFRQRNTACPYAESYLDGVCYNSVTHHEATALCSGLGARLCTQVEVDNDCTRGSGCNHDRRWIWTSTPAP